MHRNTLLLVIVLAIAAAIVTGVNISNRNTSTTLPIPPSVSSIPESPKLEEYTSTACAITFQYPETFTKAETPDNNSIFTDASGHSIVVLCQKDIPRVPLPDDKIGTVTIGSTTAKLYHDTSQKDGTPVDKLIFTHPETGLDIYIAGFGVGFNQVVSTLQLLP